MLFWLSPRVKGKSYGLGGLSEKETLSRLTQLETSFGLMEPQDYKGGMAVVCLILFGLGLSVISIILGIVLLFVNPR